MRSASAERETGALREAAHDRLGARQIVLGGGLVEQVVQLVEGGRECGGDLGRRKPEVVPGEPGHPRQCDGTAGKHGHELPVGVEVREQPAEVSLVGAEAVDEEKQAVGVAPANDVRDQRHGSLRGRVCSALHRHNTLGGAGNPKPADAPL